jgi:hypothetical protein
VIARYGRTRIGLLLAGGIGLLAFLIAAAPAFALIGEVLAALGPVGWLLLLASGALLLLGHVLRAARTKVPLDNVRKGSLYSQFQALAVGYFFNTVLPFRLGELVRSFLMARKLRISFLYTLTAVMLERVLDVMLVAATFLVIVLVSPATADAPLLFTALGALVVGAAALVLFVLLVRENRMLLQAVWRATGWLNPRLETRIRFKIWAVIFGFQRLLRERGQLTRYALYLVTSWLSYIAATAILVLGFSPEVLGRDFVVATLSPYAVTSPAVWVVNPGSFIEGVATVLPGAVGVAQVQFAVLAWIVLTVPVGLLGLAWLFTITTKPTKAHATVTPGSSMSFENKLVRVDDISSAMPHFLDSYFRGQQLSQVVHRLEVSGDMQLVQFFKGGSNAITVLAQDRSGRFVKKFVPPEYEHRLRNQYEWLAARVDKGKIVRVLREERTEAYYAIDLEYRPASVPLFDFVHSTSLDVSRDTLLTVWDYMYEEIYELEEPREHPEARDEYVRDRLLTRVDSAAQVHEGLQLARLSSHILINGQLLENYDRILERIQAHEEAWHDIGYFQRSSAIHGDLTVDNILMDRATDDVVIIDPSDDNQVRGPVIDFARHLQSLQYGYEFLNDDESEVGLEESPDGVPSISYRDNRSARYAELADFVTTEVMTRHLTAPEQRAVLFHVGLFYARMLAHRVVINPATTLKYYAVAVEAFNRFFEQYTTGKSP